MNLRTTAAALMMVPLAACVTTDDPPGAAPAPTPPTMTATADPAVDQLDETFAQLEIEYDARLGVYAVDTGTGQEITYRADERFAYASTFKALLCAVVLQHHELDDLTEVITYTRDDLVPHAPITEQHLDTGMTIHDLCDAAVRYSDNTAANLLLDKIGGPDGLGRALEAIGDEVTSVDRYEVALNEAAPGDTRDTSTPRALASDLRSFVLEDTLQEDKRALLTEWLVGNTTGDELIRAGVPDDWTVGDRTGAGGYGTRNAIAVAWPPAGDPVVIAVMSTRGIEGAEYDERLLAAATEIAVSAFPPLE